MATFVNSDLALLGGIPLNQETPPPYNTIGDEEKAAVMRVLEVGELSGFVASPGDQFWGGEQVQALEEAFRRHFGVQYAIAVNSATSGLHCAVAALGVGPGDEVIVPPYTMTATATAPLMMGAVPVFADIEDRTFGLDPEAVEAAITPCTKGIIAVNLFGHPARLDELSAIAERHSIFLIEDNAQAPDADYHGRKTATIGDIGVFSFNRHKIIQSGEGGVVVTDDGDLALRLALFRNHGEGLVGPMEIEDIVNTAGLNYRMTEMEAAVAVVQFGKLAAIKTQRVELAEHLSANLTSIDGLTPPVVEEDCSHAYYFHVSKYDPETTGLPRDLFVRAVAAEGYPIRAGYVTPIYLEPMYQRRIGLGRTGFPFSTHPRSADLNYARGICPTVERLQDRELFLTHMIYPPYTKTDMDGFAHACRKVLDHRDELLAADPVAAI